MDNNYSSILSQLTRLPQKRKIFISYHHVDQSWVDHFRSTFGSAYEVFTDCSLDQAIDSNNLLYINRTIREEYITGTSITIIICGADTWRRKCVDWEIYSTLNKDHALLGIMLPHKPVPYNEQWQWVRTVPDRLLANVNSGYAHWLDWPQSPQILSQAINHAIQRSTDYRHLKDNSAQKKLRNS